MRSLSRSLAWCKLLYLAGITRQSKGWVKNVYILYELQSFNLAFDGKMYLMQWENALFGLW